MWIDTPVDGLERSSAERTWDAPPRQLPAIPEARNWGMTGALTLRRAWPKRPGHCALEYVDERGKPAPGQWFADAQRGAAVARSTRQVLGDDAVVEIGGSHLFLQLGGADRKLPGLAPLLARPDATLIVHRPERRAVVRLGDAEGVRYAKVLPPGKARAMVEQMAMLAGLVREHLRIPTLCPHDAAHEPDAGVVVMTALPGRPLHALLDDPALPGYLTVAGEALRMLHRLPAPAACAPHDAAAEGAVIDHWLGRVGEFVPTLLPVLTPHAAPVKARLAEACRAPVLLHRDFYDKQVIVTADGRAGLLDFDTLALGEAALDVANALVHLELRAISRDWRVDRLQETAAAFLAGYDPEPAVRRRIRAYADATRLRLACVYAMRPPEAHLGLGLLARLGTTAW